MLTQFEKQTNSANACPCCHENLVRQVSSSGVRWFCLRCREEMPNLESIWEQMTLPHLLLRQDLAYQQDAHNRVSKTLHRSLR